MIKTSLLVFIAVYSIPVFADNIRIASWNIENFGKTKAADPERMAIIADRIKDYVIITIYTKTPNLTTTHCAH